MKKQDSLLSYESTVQLLNLFSQNVQGELDKVVDASFNILADNVLQEEFTRMHKAEYGSQDWLEARRNIRNRMPGLGPLSNNIVSIRLRSVDGSEFSRSIAAKSIPTALMDKYQETARSAMGRECWVSDPSAPGAVYLVRDVREVAELTLTSIAMMVLEVDMAKVVQHSSGTLSAMNMPLLCAIDLNGARVFASREELPDISESSDRFVLHETADEIFFCVRGLGLGLYGGGFLRKCAQLRALCLRAVHSYCGAGAGNGAGPGFPADGLHPAASQAAFQ